MAGTHDHLAARRVRPPVARRLAAAVTAVAVAVGAPACGSSTALVSLRPRTGAHLRYRVDVRASTTTTLDGASPRRTSDELRLTIDERVVGSSASGTTVAVELHSRTEPTQRFVAHLDRTGQLAEIARVEGLPSGVLGRLGISELFPSSAAGPPSRRLRAGDRWAVRRPVQLPDRDHATLVGSGQVTAFSIDRGRRVALVEERYRVPVRQTTRDASGTVELDGVESTTSTSSRDVSDGTAVRAKASTVGRFHVILHPPPSSPSSTGRTAVTGTMVVELDSTTIRLD